VEKMIEVTFLFIYILIYLYSFLYRNLAVLITIIVSIMALYFKVNLVFIALMVSTLLVIRYKKDGIKDEF
jgi:hypothetical protein